MSYLFDALRYFYALRNDFLYIFAARGARLKAYFAQEQHAVPTLSCAYRLAHLYLSFALRVHALLSSHPSFLPLPIEVLSSSVLKTYVDAIVLAYPSWLTCLPQADVTVFDSRVLQHAAMSSSSYLSCGL